MPDPTLRATFNSAVSTYGEIRPGYPDELINDIVDFSKISDDGRILEVGCGTGQATKYFATRGYKMVCLDIGPDMIVVAKEKSVKESPNLRPASPHQQIVHKKQKTIHQHRSRVTPL